MKCDTGTFRISEQVSFFGGNLCGEKEVKGAWGWHRDPAHQGQGAQQGYWGHGDVMTWVWLLCQTWPKMSNPSWRQWVQQGDGPHNVVDRVRDGGWVWLLIQETPCFTTNQVFDPIPSVAVTFFSHLENWGEAIITWCLLVMLIFCSDHFCLIFSLKQSLQCCAAQKQVFLLTSREIKRSLGAGGWSEGTPGCSTARHNILRLQAQAPPRNPVVAAFKNAAVWIRHSSWDIKKMRSFLSAVCSGNGVFLPTNMIDLIIPLALKILA